MRFGIIIFLLTVTLLGSGGYSRAADDKFPEAEKLYQAGEWEKARQTYSDLLTSHGADTLPPSFFYNLGTVSYRAGQPGTAYAYLLRALAARPWDGDTLHNLKIVEAKLPAMTLATQPSSWISSWPLTAHFLPWTCWLIPLLVAAAGWQWALTRDDSRTKKYLWGAVTLVLLVVGITGIQQTRAPVAAFVRNAQVKSGPGTSFPDIVALNAGAVVNTEDFRDGWKKIRFLGADLQEAVGWVEASALIDLR